MRQVLISRVKDSPFVEIHIGLLAHNVRVAATNTLDLRQGIHDLALSVDIGVQETKNVLKIMAWSKWSC